MKVKCEFCSKIFTDQDLLGLHLKEHHPEIIPTDADLDRLSRSAIFEFLRSDGTDRGLLSKAKQANAYRSTEARREQTQSARDATLVMMARELAESKPEFRKLISEFLPDTRLLLAGKAGAA